MRLLHASDLLLGNRNYRAEVREANGGVDLLDLDRRAALDRVVGCAFHHDVDLLLVAGELVDGRASVDQFRPWLDDRLAQLAAAGVAVVVYDPACQLAGAGLACQLLHDDAPTVAAGVTVASVEQVAAGGVCADDGSPLVAVGHGKLAGLGGTATFHRELSLASISAAADRAAYVALGGMLEAQPVTSNAWFAGAACSVFGYHAGAAGVLLAQLGRATGRVLDLTHVALECRRRASVTVDAGGMDVDTLANVLHRRLDELCWTVDPCPPLDPEHPLARLYGGPTGANGVGWWARPVLQVQVFGARHSFGEVSEASPMLQHMLCDGEHLLALLRWERRDAGKPEQLRFTPQRG